MFYNFHSTTFSNGIGFLHAILPFSFTSLYLLHFCLNCIRYGTGGTEVCTLYPAASRSGRHNTTQDSRGGDAFFSCSTRIGWLQASFSHFVPRIGLVCLFFSSTIRWFVHLSNRDWEPGAKSVGNTPYIRRAIHSRSRGRRYNAGMRAVLYILLIRGGPSACVRACVCGSDTSGYMTWARIVSRETKLEVRMIWSRLLPTNKHFVVVCFGFLFLLFIALRFRWCLCLI